jgi:trans-aconitate 2-methyltransferase
MHRLHHTGMPSWSAGQYLRFADERTQPCRDLVARIALPRVDHAIDLGCGPGNSTAILTQRWPDADIAGLDSSAEMIASARKSQPQRTWIVGEIAKWADGAGEAFELVFSNAALQWVPDHAGLYPRLLGRTAKGGALAVQMPGNFDAPPHRLMRDLAESHSWGDKFPADGVREWHVHDPEFYYDVLAPHAVRVDLWTTDYQHVLAGAEGIVEWYKGTGLRPFLDALGSAEDQERFCAEYLELIKSAYPPRSDGHVLFPFRRIFMIAYRPE